VDIILTNNGYEVHNLGIKKPIADILEAYHEKQADAIGMSGLLVKSVNVMEENLREMVSQGIHVPILLGGAALARNYCDSHLRSIYAEGGGKVYHGKDAFEGLRIMDKLKAGEEEDIDLEIQERLQKRADAEEKIAEVQAKDEAKKEQSAEQTDEGGGAAVAEKVRSDVRTDVKIPEPPFWGTRIVDPVDPNEIYPYNNKIALYRGQWGFKKGRMEKEEYERFIREEVDPVFNRLCKECRDNEVLNPRVVYGYYPANSDGDDLIVYEPEDHDKELERFSFPRQSKKRKLCLSDFFRPVDSGEKDVLPMHCVTVGTGASERARQLFENDQYQEYLYLHGFSVETAEGFAEYCHKRIRQELGIDSEDAAKIEDLFSQNYRGSRYSFGYPACPDMADQEKLFRLLEPQRIGCELTENWQIDPEQSTSAVVCHHPEAKYFNV
jgi:5-methyltetrahydrofolate--homocysteine methyltransferase